MRDMTYQQGETVRLTVTVEEAGASTAEFIASDGTNSLSSLDTFDGLVADVSLTIPTDKPAGSYDYYIRITWDDGSVDILPNTADCDGDCVFPQLIICEIPGVS